MREALPVVYLARHGETAWSISGQHTGLTDLPLTQSGEQRARLLGERLSELSFARVFVSPLKRARQTCSLAGFGGVAQIDPDLTEWNYGDYEGLTSEAIHATRPGWELFRDGCPGGEAPADVADRADRVIHQVRALQANVLLFSSGHFLRMLAARWLALAPSAGRCFFLNTSGLCILGYEHGLSDPVIRLWNETRMSDA